MSESPSEESAREPGQPGETPDDPGEVIFDSGSNGDRKIQSHIAEQTIIFLSVVKWILLASIIGGIVGLAAFAFLKTLKWGGDFSENFEYYYLGLPVAMLLSTELILWLAPSAAGHGTEKVIKAIHREKSHIPILVVPVKLLATWITLTFGGSVGKEGPTAQIGAGISSFFAKTLHFNHSDRRKLVICGISAGFGAVFGTPVAGAIFGVEALFVGSLAYEVLLASVVASITGYQVTSSLGLEYFYHPFESLPPISEPFFLLVLALGAFIGLVSFVLIESLHQTERLVERLQIRPSLKAFLGGTALVGLTFLLGEDYLGLGLHDLGQGNVTVESTLGGMEVVWYAFLAKILFTVITLGFGGSGGIVTPIFFIGTTAGALFAQITGQDVVAFSAIGMVCMVAGACNTPLAASIMAIELFGDEVGIYAPAACVVSFLMTGHRSVYPSQILSVGKVDELRVDTGGEIEDIEQEDPHLGHAGRRTIFLLSLLRRTDHFLHQCQTWVRDSIQRLSDYAPDWHGHHHDKDDEADDNENDRDDGDSSSAGPSKPNQGKP